MTPSDFRALRERLGLSCARIAGRYGVAPITVSRFERGISDPDANPSGAKWQPMRAVEWMRRIADRGGGAHDRGPRARPSGDGSDHPGA